MAEENQEKHENQDNQGNQDDKISLDVKDRFNWTILYPKIAEKLKKYSDDQKELKDFLIKENGKIGIPNGTADTIEKFGIDPFSFFALFNRNINNRRGVIKVFCDFLKVEIEESEIDKINFNGIPLVDHRNILFYSKDEKDNNPHVTIDALWGVFLESFDVIMEGTLPDSNFAFLFDKALEYKQVSNMLATALFWIHPYKFIPFDENSRVFIKNYQST